MAADFGALPWASKAAMTRPRCQRRRISRKPLMAWVFIPGYGPDGSPAFMRERSLAGINRFIVFQTHAPPPPAIQDHLKAGVALGYVALTSLIDFYGAQRTDQRHLFLLELTIGERV